MKGENKELLKKLNKLNSLVATNKVLEDEIIKSSRNGAMKKLSMAELSNDSLSPNRSKSPTTTPTQVTYNIPSTSGRSGTTRSITPPTSRRQGGRSPHDHIEAYFARSSAPSQEGGTERTTYAAIPPPQRMTM